MLTFSERAGIVPIRVEIQREKIDDNLRNALWNAVYIFYLRNSGGSLEDLSEPMKSLFYKLWLHHYHRKIDEIKSPEYISFLIKEEFTKTSWNKILDLIEFLPNNYIMSDYDGGHENSKNKDFISFCNDHFEKAISAYRFINYQIIEITATEEISSIENALNNQAESSAIKIHLKRALELFSNRTNPDYRNSIKESISAVEAYCKLISGEEKTTLGKALAIIEKKHNLHGSLKSAFSALYGYSSDAAGIRHSLLEESDLKQEDAKFMLVTCSAFINYLAVKSST